MGVIFNTFWGHDWQLWLVHAALGRAKSHNACPTCLLPSGVLLFKPLHPLLSAGQRDRGTRGGTVWRRASQGSWREASEASWSGFGVSGGAGWSRGSEKGKGVDRTEGRDKESQEFSGGNRGDRKPRALWRKHTGEKQVLRKVCTAVLRLVWMWQETAPSNPLQHLVYAS